MGTWGTGIFDDDLALDIQEEYLNHIENGHSAQNAIKLLIETFKEELDDPEESNVFWLSVAATQLDIDHLSEMVKKKALTIINSDDDLERWMGNPNLYKDRKKVLERLKNQLLQY